jgi:hypothetical protein
VPGGTLRLNASSWPVHCAVSNLAWNTRVSLLIAPPLNATEAADELRAMISVNASRSCSLSFSALVTRK